MDTKTYTIEDLRSWAKSGPGELSPPPRLAVFGDPVAHSLSPQMHNPALQAAGIDAQYVRLHITPEILGEALRLLPEANFLGTNITIPHKTATLDLVDQVDELAKARRRQHRRLRGQIPPRLQQRRPGFLRAIREEFHVDVRDLRVLILGAGGGAGRAIATQCAIESCERLVLVNRTVEKVPELKKELEPHFHDERVLGPTSRLTAIPWEETALAPDWTRSTSSSTPAPSA